MKEEKSAFSVWIWRKHKLSSIVLTISAFIHLIYHLVEIRKGAFTGGPSSSPAEPYIALASSLVHTIVISILLVMACKTPFIDPERPSDDFSNAAVDRFHKAWRMLWVTWFVFYMAMVIHDFIRVAAISDSDLSAAVQWRYWEPGLSALNNFQTLFILVCYFVLAEHMTASTRQKHQHSQIVLYSPLVVALLLGLVFLTVGSFLHTGLVGLHHQAATTIAALAEHPGEMVLKLMSGVLSGIALALLVGRLDSALIEAPQWTIVLLYVYAMIQPLFVLFGVVQYMEEIVTALALLLKLLLFWFVYWLLMKQEGDLKSLSAPQGAVAKVRKSRLLFYFDRMQELPAKVNEDWFKFNSPEPSTRGAAANEQRPN